MGIFDEQSELFTRYHARLQFRDKLMGGTPKDPRVIEGWLRSKTGITDEEEIKQATLRTMLEIGVEGMTFGEMEKASEALAATRQTNGFKRDKNGLYIEARTIKAMLKECTNILFAGEEKWGPTKKGPKSFLAERVFVSPEVIHLGVSEPTSVEMVIGHVTGPGGPRSTLAYHEYVLRPAIEFDILVTRDAIKPAQWVEIWVHAQRNGLGALRSQGHGCFDIEAWDRVN